MYATICRESVAGSTIEGMSDSNKHDPLRHEPAEAETQLSPFQRISAQGQRLILFLIPGLIFLTILSSVIYNTVIKQSDEDYFAEQTAEAIQRIDEAEIRISGPFTGQMFNAGTQVVFSWDWQRPLDTGDEFVVRLDGDVIGRVDAPSNNTFYRMMADSSDWSAGEYAWDISLENNGNLVADVPPVSATLMITTFIPASTPTVPAPATPTPATTGG